METSTIKMTKYIIKAFNSEFFCEALKVAAKRIKLPDNNGADGIGKHELEIEPEYYV